MRIGRFSLVEMIAVIAIVGVLAGLLLPAIQRARASAVNVACVGNLRQIGLGLNQYAQANDFRLPYCRQLADNADAPDALPSFADTIVASSGGVRDIFRCPGEADREYFERYGSSYEWNALLNGHELDRQTFLLSLGVSVRNAPYSGDAKTNHAAVSRDGRNFLYPGVRVGGKLEAEAE